MDGWDYLRLPKANKMKFRIRHTAPDGSKQIIMPDKPGGFSLHPNGSILHHSCNEAGGFLAVYASKTFEPERFTGLKDVHKNEIFEGDILALPSCDFERGENGNDDRAIIAWFDETASFELVYFSKWGGEGWSARKEPAMLSRIKEMQVIGNEFLNPELLTIDTYWRK